MGNCRVEFGQSVVICYKCDTLEYIADTVRMLPPIKDFFCSNDGLLHVFRNHSFGYCSSCI